MTWELKSIPQHKVSPELMYDVGRRHKLVPDSASVAVASCRALAHDGMVSVLYDGEAQIGTVVISGLVQGEQAELDFIPVGKHFRKLHKKELVAAMAPLLGELFGRLKVRRITSYVPESRSRAYRALCSLGFGEEGKMREGCHLRNRDPEGLFILGLLPEDVVKE